MGRRSRLLTGIALSAALLVVGACGDDDGGDGGGAEQPSGEPVATVELAESDFKIDPREPKVDEGGLVRFELRNTGQTEHALEVHGPEGEAETEPFGPGETATLDVELEPGSYEMYCPVGDHRDRGMTGTVTVRGAGGAGGGTTTEEEQEDEGGGGGYGY